MSNQTVTTVEEKVLVIERSFKAPRELVFEAFSKAEHLKHWWGPQGWTLPVCHIDFRVGGVWHYCMKCEDRNQGDFYGMESWGKAIYDEIEMPEKIAYTDYFSDAEGNLADNMPSTLCTLTFIEVEGGTKIINRAEYATAEGLKQVLDMGMVEGFTQTWNRLEEHLEEIQKSSGTPERVTVETVVHAPLDQVWACWTEPEHITKWNAASDDWHTTRAENDLRAGGKFMSRMEAKDGSFGFDFGGVYDEVRLNEYIAYTMEDGRKVEITFEAQEDGVKVIETFDAETTNSIEMQRGGWNAILGSFKTYVEGLK